MDTIRKKAENYIEKYKMLEDTRNVVAGVSGGADSMCMLHLLYELKEKYGYHLAVVHIHHGMRGKDADDDMAYVENFCKSRQISFYGFRYKVEELAGEWHMSSEEAGRKVRYEAFHRVLKEMGGGKTAVAHNSDDNSETFLFNLFRGTGLQGLTGIKPVRNDIIRPVLCLGRKEILEYLRENGIDYRTDVTNQGEMYTRNKIRNRILPYVRENINERAVEHILQAADSMEEICAYMDRQAETAWNQVAERRDNAYEISVSGMEALDGVIQKMVCRRAVGELAGKLKDITAVHIGMVLELMKGDTGKRVNLPYQIICERQYGILRLYRGKSEKEREEFCVECRMETSAAGDEKTFFCPSGEIHVKIIKNVKSNIKIQENRYTKRLDYDILNSNFQIRNRRAGDYIIINCRGGRKKLKDYFIDLKIPREERDRVPLLARGSEVFWVIGYRISERCRVSEKTGLIAEIEYFANEEGVTENNER